MGLLDLGPRYATRSQIGAGWGYVTVLLSLGSHLFGHMCS